MDPESNLDEQINLAQEELDTVDHLHERVTGDPLPETDGIEDEFDLLDAAQHMNLCPCSSYHRTYRRLSRASAGDADCTCGAYRAAHLIRSRLDNFDRLCELVLALDGWIAGQGFLPPRWQREEPVKCEAAKRGNSPQIAALIYARWLQGNRAWGNGTLNPDERARAAKGE